LSKLKILTLLSEKNLEHELECFYIEILAQTNELSLDCNKTAFKPKCPLERVDFALLADLFQLLYSPLWNLEIELYRER